jgi:hypothetical protein
VGLKGNHRYKNLCTFSICNTSQNSTSQKSLSQRTLSEFQKQELPLKKRTKIRALKVPSPNYFSVEGKTKTKTPKNKKLTAN